MNIYLYICNNLYDCIGVSYSKCMTVVPECRPSGITLPSVRKSGTHWVGLGGSREQSYTCPLASRKPELMQGVSGEALPEGHVWSNPRRPSTQKSPSSSLQIRDGWDSKVPPSLLLEAHTGCFSLWLSPLTARHRRQTLHLMHLSVFWASSKGLSVQKPFKHRITEWQRSPQSRRFKVRGMNKLEWSEMHIPHTCESELQRQASILCPITSFLVYSNNSFLPSF